MVGFKLSEFLLKNFVHFARTENFQKDSSLILKLNLKAADEAFIMR